MSKLKGGNARPSGAGRYSTLRISYLSDFFQRALTHGHSRFPLSTQAAGDFVLHLRDSVLGDFILGDFVLGDFVPGDSVLQSAISR